MPSTAKQESSSPPSKGANNKQNTNVAWSSPPPGSRPLVLVAAAAIAIALGALSKWSTQQTTDYAVCSTSNNIYTVDAANPTAQCIVVRDTRIADVGQLGLSPQAWNWTGPSDWRYIQLMSKPVGVRRQQGPHSACNCRGHRIPGNLLSRSHLLTQIVLSFQDLLVRRNDFMCSIQPISLDAHAHILEYGAMKLNVDLSGCTSKQGGLRSLHY